jgi:hypothetical protein
MQEAVTLTFIFQTIGVILLCTAIAIVLVNKKTKKLNKKKD